MSKKTMKKGLRKQILKRVYEEIHEHLKENGELYAILILVMSIIAGLFSIMYAKTPSQRGAGILLFWIPFLPIIFKTCKD